MLSMKLDQTGSFQNILLMSKNLGKAILKRTIVANKNP